MKEFFLAGLAGLLRTSPRHNSSLQKKFDNMATNPCSDNESDVQGVSHDVGCDATGRSNGTRLPRIAADSSGLRSAFM